MIAALALTGWIASGAVSSLALPADRDEPRWQWMPMAIFFGPMWLAIAAEQRSARPSTQH